MNIIEKAVQEANVEYFATPRTDAFIAGQETAKVSIWEALTNIQDFARQLERELAAARRDAERYRWLRNLGGWPDSELGRIGMTPEDFDEMCDRGIKESK